MQKYCLIGIYGTLKLPKFYRNDLGEINQGLLNRWTVQLGLGCTTGGVERVVSVHNST